MDAPDRAAMVSDIWNRFPPRLVLFPNGETKFPDDDARRAYLMLVLIPKLNEREVIPGEWGYLIKSDDGDRIPADIIVWKDTLDHFDVLTDKGPTWGPHGKIKSSWKFGSVSRTEPGEPGEPEEPEEGEPTETTPSEKILLALISMLGKLDALIELQKAEIIKLEAGLADVKKEISKGIKITF